MPCWPSASAQVRASAIWPTAAAAWLSSSLSAPGASLSTARPSAIAPEDTTMTSRFCPCSPAISAASEASQTSFTRPAAESTSSEEPTLTMMRRKSASRGIFIKTICAGICKDGRLAFIEHMRVRAEASGMPGGRIGGRRLGSALALIDYPDQRPQRLHHALAARRRQHQRRALGGAAQAFLLPLQALGIERVRLGQRHHLRLLREPMAIRCKFAAYRLVGVASVLAGAVDQVQQHPAALGVAEEAVADTGAFVRALDQAGNVGEHELAFIDARDAQLRVQRGERIIRDLRLGGADGSEQCRLAGVRQSDDAGVGDQLEPQPDRALLSGLAGIGVTRRAV